MKFHLLSTLVAGGLLISCGAAAGATGAGPMSPFFVRSGWSDAFLLAGPSEMARLDAAGVAFGAERKIAVRFLGARPEVQLTGASAVAGRANFLVGRDASAWRTGVALYTAVQYHDLWPGIDLVYRMERGRLKSEFRVAPGASPAQIRWSYNADAQVAIEGDGGLRIISGGARLGEAAPEIFQGAHRIEGKFVETGFGEYGFSVGPYDAARPLLIDPVLQYSSFLGGSAPSSATAIAHDITGDIVVTGWTASLDLPGAPTAIGSGGSVDAFVAKVNGFGSGLIFCTYIGGSGDDRATGVAVDSNGNILVTGATTSRNFPLTAAFQSVSGGGRDAFVIKLDATGKNVAYATYLGGSDADGASSVAVDAAGNAYVTGDTRSLNFPVLNALRAQNAGGQDAFLTKLSPSGQVVFSTYLGGSGDDRGASVAVDSSGQAHVTGSTYSRNFPTVSAWQPASGGNQDAFLTKFNAAGSALVYSTYFGGSNGVTGQNELANAVALDTSGNAYIAGQTSSTNFPVSTNAFQTVSDGGIDAFVAKFGTSGAMLYSTLLSGNSVDVATALAVGPAGNAFVAGYTASRDFPSLRPIQATNNGIYNAFLTQLDPTGQSLRFSTFFGGSNADQATAVSIDSLGAVLMAGATSSSDFPVKQALQPWLSGSMNGFVAKIPMGWKMGCFTGGYWVFDYQRDFGWDGQSGTLGSSWFGTDGDIPVMGDWTGTGQVRIGVFRAGTWYLDITGNGNYDSGSRSFVFGQPGDKPVVGDWNGTGVISAGLFRNGLWILDLSGHLQGSPTGQADLQFNYGSSTSIPVVGDWNGSGRTQVGVVDNGIWTIDYNGNHVMDSGDAIFTYGLPTDQPVVGDWNGSGRALAGAVHTGAWALDYNANYVKDSAAGGDLIFNFGPSNCVAVIGR